MNSQARRAQLGLPLLALAFALLALGESLWLHLLPFDHWVLDRMIRLHASSLTPDPDIVIVDVDESSLGRMQEVAGNWPWPRATHAELVEGIATQRPAAIVFDILFGEHDVYRPQSDELFIKSLRAHPNVYLPSILLEGADPGVGVRLAEVAQALRLVRGPAAQPDAIASMVLPLFVPAELWRTGTINALSDEDGIHRRYALQRDVQGWGVPSLPARLAQDFGWPHAGVDLVLHWRGSRGAYRHLPYVEVLEDFGRRERGRPADEFTGKIVIVGSSASGLYDSVATPVSSDHPGVEVLATAIDNLKNQRWLTPAPTLLPAALALALIGAVLLAFQRHWHVFVTGALLGVVTLTVLGLAYAALDRRWLLPVLTPLLFAWLYFVACALLGYLAERRTRLQAVRLFGRFLDPHVVKRIVDQGETIESLSGKTREISVLFSDIRGFTSRSESSSPQDVVTLLNRYFSRQVAIVFKHGGTLDKFIGDCIMAFWGAPLDDPQHARNSVACALEMERVLLEFKRELGRDGEDFDVGIGIHSGSAVVGFIGAEQKLDYTAIGDTVNLASRIEGLTKNVARILVSSDTARACRDAFQFTPRGQFPVKGRAQAVELFEPRMNG